MAHPASPTSDTDRIYACQHCPKRYARKDYLERHELNREYSPEESVSVTTEGVQRQAGKWRGGEACGRLG
ncbi:hypothetical protein CC85DRAFT_283496 [Cutaneotrichosporon oleaginosum]|uniref:C2H2-type domain-containing protein n=1 Tax=Cutaneotrichosporon oleaginosum TaxID=879819 RepID=A0A0J0XTZ9_9TREE|nr:uncharacterized protein CC85DRAFT_283496 [Cutaneotrichosporon oleaginosum]KLT44558.1 hypothetical protein CC85DRAFT_283496 [Cutaneotrichosporon oleaginosum]TXT13928.1 hypothetical protein COLE_00121 [Cutaneotrichosporon oleaginosum]